METPEPLQREPLLTEHFMTRAYNKYTAPQVAAMGGEVKPFAIKQLNVMDPILPNNNLGRSVSKASYLRIRRAFEHGARMLAAIAEQTKVRPGGGTEGAVGEDCKYQPGLNQTKSNWWRTGRGDRCKQ